MAIRTGKSKDVDTPKGQLLPRNKVFQIVGKGLVIKGKVKLGSS